MFLPSITKINFHKPVGASSNTCLCSSIESFHANQVSMLNDFKIVLKLTLLQLEKLKIQEWISTPLWCESRTQSMAHIFLGGIVM